MARRQPTAEALERAVKLSLIPGMTLAQSCQAAGVSLAALRRARKISSIRLTRDDLLLAALTRNGEQTEGPIGDLAAIAAWLDYVNHDGSRAPEIEQDLVRLAADGWLTIESGRFRMLRRW